MHADTMASAETPTKCRPSNQRRAQFSAMMAAAGHHSAMVSKKVREIAALPEKGSPGLRPCAG